MLFSYTNIKIPGLRSYILLLPFSNEHDKKPLSGVLVSDMRLQTNPLLSVLIYCNILYANQIAF